jgi:CheY-like chemotaxis protein
VCTGLERAGKLPRGVVPRAIRRFVLIVDDEEMSRELVELHLRKLDAAPTAVADGSAAARRIGEKSRDIVLLDLAMPTMDGFETPSRLRSAGYHGPARRPFHAVNPAARRPRGCRRGLITS